MNPSRNKSLTLLELLIAVSIFALIFIGFSSIDSFSRYHVISSDKRAKLQFDAAYVLEHMAKNISRATGDINQVAVDNTSRISGDAGIKVWVDSNSDGKRDGSDYQVAYRYYVKPGVSPQYEIWYCPNCANEPCGSCNPAWGTSDNILSRKVSSFTSPAYDSSKDYIEIALTTCWDPDGSPDNCASRNNPAVSMRNRIYMPAVSAH